MHFLAELKRRKVVRVAIVYGVVGFAIMEAADIMVTALGLPAEFTTFVVAATILGYPIAIVLAWSFDIVPDENVKHAAQAGLPDADSKEPARFSPFRVVLTLGVIISIALSWYQISTSPPEVATRTGVTYIDSVAVMPLDNLTGDASYDHLGIGITEEVITHLARIPPLKVISRHSVQAVGAQRLTTPQIANALGVRHVIEGSIRLDGDNFRVTLQHIDAESDAHVWAETFRGSINDVIALQEDVARQVTSRVVLMIPGIPQPNMTTHVDLGPGQEAYLTGKRWLGQRTPEGLIKAIESFTLSLQVDPKYAPAYADLASGLCTRSFLSIRHWHRWVHAGCQSTRDDGTGN